MKSYFRYKMTLRMLIQSINTEMLQHFLLPTIKNSIKM